jgi:glycosyltransferase involved in cell wall biosynthesis
VVILAHNKAPIIGRLLTAVVVAPYVKQIVVVDDGSSDGTSDALEEWKLRTGQTIELVRHSTNRGKGAAIRSGLTLARGAVTIVQDADLEYDPSE